MVHSEFIELHRATSLDASRLRMLRAVRLISHSVRKSLGSSDVARCNSMNSERTIIDLLAAFDTIDHDILFIRLESIGVKGLALAWLKSYLYNRSQAFNINGTLSSKSPHHFSVPQGSVLGPILFNIYSLPILHGIMVCLSTLMHCIICR